MVSKSEKRALRNEHKFEKFEKAKEKLIAKVALDPDPKIQAQPNNASIPRVAPHIARAAMEEMSQPKVVKDGSRFGAKITWCRSQADVKDFWSWGEPRAWLEQEWTEEIHPPFVHFQNLTWGEVDSFSSDSGHKMHHGHEIGDLIPEVQDRWKELELEQFESVFRFRLSGVKRAWGYILQSHFFLVWWDRKHSFYPTEPN